MNRRYENLNKAQQRKRIASVAARLVAEHGIGDYALAKRKATHGLGLPEDTQLPDNAELEMELSTYQRLFHADEHTERIADLLRIASETMLIMQKFNPYLTGSVLDGTAGRYAEIDIQLYTDSAKDVEIYLLNQRISYEHSTPRSERAEAVLTIHNEGSVVNLIVYPTKEERVTLKTHDGRVRQRARLDAVNRLLLTSTPRDTP